MLIFSPNLALDHILDVDTLLLDEVQRATSSYLSAGGKGVNVARASRCLGHPTLVVGFLSGLVGELVKQILANEGIKVDYVNCGGETRIATIILDRLHQTTTVVNESGPPITTDHWQELIHIAVSHLRTQGAPIVACTGSLPPGASRDGYVQFIERCHEKGAFVIVDANSELLARSLAAKPDVVKVNLLEAESVTKPALNEHDLSPEVRAKIAAMALHNKGARVAVVTVGRKGVAVSNDEVNFFFYAPDVIEANAVGAGDSFLAGLGLALDSGRTILESCAYATAAASASVETNKPGYLESSRVRDLESRVIWQ